MKRVSNVNFADGEPDVDPVGSVRPAKLGRLDLGSSFKTVATVEGESTDIGLSDIDAMIGQGTSTGKIGPTGFFSRNMKVEMPPREGLAAQERFSQKAKFYPSQSAKTLLEDFFEINASPVLDLDHITNGFSANEMIQFARAVGLLFTLASYGLLEDLLLRARRTGSLSGLGEI